MYSEDRHLHRMTTFSIEDPSTELRWLSMQTMSDRHLRIANLCLNCDKRNGHITTSLDCVIVLFILFRHSIQALTRAVSSPIPRLPTRCRYLLSPLKSQRPCPD